MLKPKYLEQLPGPMIELYSQAEQDILSDMARRISTYDYWIPAADWQYRKLIEMGNFHSYVMTALSARTGKSRAELERLMNEAGAKALRFDTAIYHAHGLSPPPLAESEALRAVLADGLRKTNGLFDNMTATTANTVTRQFEQALDRAWFQITSGGFDRNAAIRTAVKDLSRQGVGAVTYPSGHVDTIEVAVRRAVVTGVNQCALRLQDTLADEMGCDLVETTAHSGARPSHAVWQGRVFSRSGRTRKYPDFVKATGYGSGDGLGGWNCRHSFFPYFEGSPRAYTEKDLDALEEKNVTYNGEKLTEYEASQRQRYIERQIRRWKRENMAMEDAGQDTEESAAKIRQWQDAQKDFLKQTGFKRQSDREQVAGFGPKQAARARAAETENGKQTSGKVVEKKPAPAILNEEEKGAVTWYIGGSPYEVNRKLRDGQMLTDAESTAVKNLDSAISKLPVYQGTVTRDLNFMSLAEFKAFAARYTVGNDITEASFVSVTTLTAYQESPQVRMRIKSKTARDLRDFNPDESEVVFPRNTKFHVLSVHRENNTFILEVEEK